MLKKTDQPMGQAEQSRRFLEAARDIEADSGLSPNDAIAALVKLVARHPSNSGGHRHGR